MLGQDKLEGFKIQNKVTSVEWAGFWQCLSLNILSLYTLLSVRDTQGEGSNGPSYPQGVVQLVFVGTFLFLLSYLL